MLPRRAQKSGTGQSTLLSPRTDVPEIAAAYPLAEDHYMAAADVQKTYVASENIDTLIDKAREDMERAAKSLDFLGRREIPRQDVRTAETQGGEPGKADTPGPAVIRGRRCGR